MLDLLPYAIPAVGFVAGAGAFIWRIGVLERNAEKRDEHARQDRKEIHDKINTNTADIAEIKGYIRGKGKIE